MSPRAFSRAALVVLLGVTCAAVVAHALSVQHPREGVPSEPCFGPHCRVAAFDPYSVNPRNGGVLDEVIDLTSNVPHWEGENAERGHGEHHGHHHHGEHSGHHRHHHQHHQPVNPTKLHGHPGERYEGDDVAGGSDDHVTPSDVHAIGGPSESAASTLPSGAPATTPEPSAPAESSAADPTPTPVTPTPVQSTPPATPPPAPAASSGSAVPDDCPEVCGSPASASDGQKCTKCNNAASKGASQLLTAGGAAGTSVMETGATASPAAPATAASGLSINLPPPPADPLVVSAAIPDTTGVPDSLAQAIARDQAQNQALTTKIFTVQAALEQQTGWLDQATNALKRLERQMAQTSQVKADIQDELNDLRDQKAQIRRKLQREALERDLGIASTSITSIESRSTDLRTRESNLSESAREIQKKIDELHQKLARALAQIKNPTPA